VVLRADTDIHYDRLKERKYDQKKLDENVDCEIMQVILEDARDTYPPEIVIELKSNTMEDLDSNVERIKSWIEQWHKNNT
jgi:adenylate kinase